MLHPEALDPEIREAVRDIPDFVFSAETVPMMRQNAVFRPSRRRTSNAPS